MGSSCSSSSSAVVATTAQNVPRKKQSPVTLQAERAIQHGRKDWRTTDTTEKNAGESDGSTAKETLQGSQASHKRYGQVQDTRPTTDFVQYEKKSPGGLSQAKSARISSAGDSDRDSVESLCRPGTREGTLTPGVTVEAANAPTWESETRGKKKHPADKDKPGQSVEKKNNVAESKKSNRTTTPQPPKTGPSSVQLKQSATRESVRGSVINVTPNKTFDAETNKTLTSQNFSSKQDLTNKSFKKKENEKAHPPEVDKGSPINDKRTDSAEIAEETGKNSGEKELDSVPPETRKKPEITRRITKEELIPDLSVFKELDSYARQTPGHAESSIPLLVDYLTRPTRTVLERTRVLFMWVSTHVKYDVNSYVTGTSSRADASPEAVLKTRLSVCQGYADLFAELCRLANIPCRTISGKAKGFDYVVGSKVKTPTNHAWNAVQINGHWYLIDCTWAAGHSDLSSRTFIFKYTEHYFLTEPEFLISDHLPLDDQWQLLEDPVSSETFESWVRLKAGFFDLGLRMRDLSHTKAYVPTKSGSATIRISIHEPMSFVVHLKPSDGRKKSTEIMSHVLHEIVNMEARFRVVPPTEGSFLLKIYAKRGTSSGSHEFLLEYLIQCKIPKAAITPFPSSNKGTILGPGHFLLDGVISATSHSEAIVDVPEGDVKIQFEFDIRLNFMCNFGTDSRWNEYVLVEHEDACATFYLRCPEPGLHSLTIWAKEDTGSGDGSYHKHCTYIMRCKKKKPKCVPFPKIFSTWTSGCKVFRPKNGRLASNRVVQFRVRWPMMLDVVVIADGKWFHLVQGSDDCWEGNATTGSAGTALQVAGKTDPTVKSYGCLLEYAVVK